MAILQADDFEVGMTVTGYDSGTFNVQVPGPEGVELKEIQDRTYQHGVYRIKAIELPYLALECVWHQGGPQLAGMYQADTRIYRFMKVSAEFVQAFPDQLTLAKLAEKVMMDRAKMLSSLDLNPHHQEGAS